MSDLFQPIIKPRGYWTKDRCAEQALKYPLRGELFKYSQKAYQSALKNGWLDEICLPASPKLGQKIIWTYDAILKRARLWKSIIEFRKNEITAYKVAHRRKWLNDIYREVGWIPRNPANYWTKEMCHELALKCKSRSEFISRFYPAYLAAGRKRWMNDICKHMIFLGNKHLRYVYEIIDVVKRVVYVGLTFHPSKRLAHHSRTSKIMQHFPENLKMRVLTPLLESSHAAKIEMSLISFYKTTNFTVLNANKGGTLGSGSY